LSAVGDWIANLPAHWETKPLKAVASYTVSNVDKIPAEDEFPVRLCNYTHVYNNEFISPNLELMRTTATASEIDKFHLVKDDVVITKDSESWDDIAVPALVVESADDLLCGYHLAILRPKQNAMNGRFLFRCLQSKAIRLQLELASTGVTRFGLPKGEIGRLLLPITSITDQHHIADYLDRETAQIDALLAEKERMLALLEEKRAALVSRAVTRGINPNVPLKPSGLPWLGDIPTHWQVVRGKYLYSQASIPVEEGDEIVTCFRDGQVTLRKNRREEGFTNAVKELGYQGIRAGQLVLHSMDAFAGALGISDSDGKCSPEYIICNPLGDHVLNEYYANLLRVMALRGFIHAACPAVRERAPRIRFPHLAAMFLPVPPRVEQEQIVAAVAQERAETAEIEATLKQSIALLRERRSALITAAVTGQIDVSS
jgi:type I restriction enzyme, S subunit